MERPAAGANKADQAAYAAHLGLDATGTKAEIVARIDEYEASKTDAGDERQAAGGGTETVPEGVVTASEPEQAGGESGDRNFDEVGEGVTTSENVDKPAEG